MKNKEKVIQISIMKINNSNRLLKPRIINNLNHCNLKTKLITNIQRINNYSNKIQIILIKII